MRNKSLGQLFGILFVSMWAIMAVFPLYSLLVNAFNNPPAYGVTDPQPAFWPSPATWANINRIWGDPDFPRWYLNTIIVAGTLTISNVLLATLGGYALAKMQFPGRKLIFTTIIISMMIPAQVSIIPLFRFVADLGLVNSNLALILPGLVSAYGIFLIKQSLSTLPTEMFESARIDGCSEPRLFWHLVLPLSKPGMGVLAILTFVGFWNDFQWPMIVLQDRTKFTLQVGLTRLLTENGAFGAGLSFAGAFLSALPIFIIFFALQRYFVQGITVGSVKG